MEIYSIFTQLKMAECLVGDLYTLLYMKISHEYPDLGNLFRKLAEEEKGHENIITMAKDYFLEDEKIFKKSKNAENIIKDMMKSLEARITKIKSNMANINPGKLMQAVYDLEKDLESRHYTYYVSIEDENIKGVLRSLVTADQGHKESIKALLEKYKYLK